MSEDRSHVAARDLFSRQIKGCLIGGAVGDALGLPGEGLSRQRIARLWKGEWYHRLVGKAGMFSDDTEHALITALSLLEHPDDETAFAQALARHLRLWLAALPAGTGMATARAILRLWLGFPPGRSGVTSAGNGPTMRSAVIGARFATDAVKRRTFALVSCRLTHVDLRAEEAALLTAEAAALAAQGAAQQVIVGTLEGLITSDEMQSRWQLLRGHLERSASVQAYATAIQCANAVSGFAPNTVAIALYAWLRHRGDYRTAMTELLNCGGDIDTMGAVLGGIMGAETSETEIPQEWMDGIRDWPRSLGYVKRVADAFEGGRTPSLFWPAIPARNLFFLAVVICHGLRRLLPPY